MENCKELYKEGTPEYDACVEKNKSEKNTEEKSWGQQFFEWGAKKIAGGIVNKLVENQKERIDEIENIDIEEDYYQTLADNISTSDYDKMNTKEQIVVQDLAVKELTKLIPEGENYTITPMQVNAKVNEILLNTRDKVSGETKTALEKIMPDNPIIAIGGDLVRATENGWGATTSLDATYDLFKSGGKPTDEMALNWLKETKISQQSMETSDEMRDFAKVYEAEGKGFWGFVKGVYKNPDVLPGLLASSLATQIGSIVNSDEVAGSAAGGGLTGAAAGSYLPGVGNVAGAISGAMGATTAAMETGLTFSELLIEELGGDIDKISKDQVIAFLNDEEKYKDLKKKAIGRGMSIGFFEMMSMGLTGKVSRKLIKAGKKGSTVIASGVGIESVMGGSGEVAGRLAAGQDMDAAEIGFETITGSQTAVVPIGTAYMQETFDGIQNRTNDIKANGFFGDGKKYRNISEAYNPENKVDETQVEVVSNPRAETVLDNELKKQVDNKTITQNEANNVKLNFRSTQSAVNKLKQAGVETTLDNSQQAMVINLLKDKQKLEAQVKDNDPSLVKKQKQKIEAINSEIENVISPELDVETTDKTVVDEDVKIVEKSKREVASEKVQEIYDSKGREGSFEIIEQFKPIVNKIVQSRRDAPNFDAQLLTDEIETGKRGIIDLIDEYDASKGVPLAAFINKNIPLRAIESSKRILGEKFTIDVTEARGVTDGTDINIQIQEDLDITPRTEQQKASVTKLRDIAGITTQEAQTGVTETLKTRLPGVTEKKFRQKVNEANRLKFGEKVLAEMGGLKDAGRLVTFLDTNFDNIINAIPNNVKNKQLASLFKPKQVGRAKTAVGEGVFEYSTPTKQELIDFYTTGKNTTNRARVKTLADVIAQELALDATAEVLADPKVQKEFIDIQEIQGKDVPKDVVPKLLDVIDRQIAKLEKFSSEYDNVLGMNNPKIIADALKIGLKAFKSSIKNSSTTIQALGKAIRKIKEFIKNSKLADIVARLFTDKVVNNDLKNISDIVAEADRELKVVNGDISALLKKYGLRSKYVIETAKNKPENKKDIDLFIKDMQENVFPVMPEGLFKPKSKFINYAAATPYFNAEIIKALNNPNQKWGDDFNDVPKNKNGNYNIPDFVDYAGRTEAEIVNNIKSGKIANQNKINNAIFTQMWQRFDALIKADPKNAVVIGSYMTLSGNIGNHPQRMGAEFIGYSTGVSGKIIMEHAMPNVSSYLYLLDSSLDKKRDFKVDFDLIKKNYKVIALDKLADNKLKPFGLTTSMPKGWMVSTGSWIDRYFNTEVATLDGGIDPATIKTVDGKTLAETFNIGPEGRPVVEIENSTLKAASVIEKGEIALSNKPSLQPTITDPAVLDKDINKMIKDTKGIAEQKRFSDVVAKRRGAGVRNFRLISSGAQDFNGLMYDLYGKGRIGEQQQAWVKKNLVKPYQDGIANIDKYRQALKNDYATLLKKFPEVTKKLGKIAPGTEFTFDQALRVNLWTEAGFEIPGLSKRDTKKLNDIVNKDPELKLFNQAALEISKQDTWVEPSPYWDTESLISDLNNLTNKVGRKQFLADFITNSDVIFSKENLNKMEVALGTNWRDAMEDSLYRMRNGTNRPAGTNKLTNNFLNWVNNSVGAIMFFNIKSALLQTISSVNFLNWSDNNPYKAAMAFGNQPQFWSDFTTLWNSPKLKQRRSGLRKDVNEAELANAAKGATNKASAALSYLLKLGFTPTQMADSFAIASGGATFYRNRINTLKKQGLDQKAAEEQAFADFAEASDVAQQSADPMLISSQQASPLGRLILAFQNTPAQVTRIFNKSARDFINGRGDQKTNISKMIYYGAVQGFIFATLQNAAFALIPGFDDEEKDEEEKAKDFDKKEERILNSMVDTMLRGSGVYGAIVATLKNTAATYYREEQKSAFGKDHTNTLTEIMNLSPPVGSKLRKINNAIKAKEYNSEVVKEQGWDVTLKGKVNLSPSYQVIASLTEAITNLPLERAVVEIDRVVEMLDARNTTFQRVALALGYRTWDVGTKNEERDLVKIESKEAKEKARKQKVIDDRAERKRLKELEKYKGKTKEEIKQMKRRDSIVDTNKSDQVKSLINLGLTKKQIKELKYEDDRVNKIIELTNK